MSLHLDKSYVATPSHFVAAAGASLAANHGVFGGGAGDDRRASIAGCRIFKRAVAASVA
jgi:hypothetical protein